MRYEGQSFGFDEDSTRWQAFVTDDDQPGFRMERNGKVLYVLLNYSSNEPTLWVYAGSLPTPGEGDCQPLHFYYFEEELT